MMTKCPTPYPGSAENGCVFHRQ